LLDDVFTWQGLPVIESPFAYDTKKRMRTQKERWLSWPWKPFQKWECWQEPCAYVLKANFLGQKTLICHPEIKKRLIKAIDDMDIGKRV